MNQVKKNRQQILSSSINRTIDNIKDSNTHNEDALNQLECQIRQSFGSVVHKHKTHEKCAEASLKSYMHLKNWQIILSSSITTTILVDIIGTSIAFKIIGMILSIILFGIILYSQEFRLGEASEKHLDISKKLWDLRECYLSLLTDLKVGYLGIREIQMKRDMFQEKMVEICSLAPKTDVRIYNKARKLLEDIDEPVFSEEEIDRLLPKHLKKSS